MHYHNICINLNQDNNPSHVPKPKNVIINILPPSVTFSHDQPLYLSCTTTPLGKGLSPTFHRLTSNNSTCSTKTWVKELWLKETLSP